MEQEQKATNNLQPNRAVKIKELIDRLVSTAAVIDKNITDKEDGTVWPYASSIAKRTETICDVVLGAGSSENMGLIDRLSAMFTIERDIILSGWTDDITGKIADSLTFESEDFNKNEGICAYFFDLCAFVSHVLEMKAYLDNALETENATEEDVEIKGLVGNLDPVLKTLDNISSACAQ